MTYSKFFSRLAGLLSLVVLTSLTAVAQTPAPRLVTQKIDETKLTTLTGHIHPAANALNDRGPVNDNAPVGHIILLLKRSASQQLDLDALVDQLHNPKSENYRKWLTPADFGRRFGPADEDVAAVVAWLQSKGFTIEDVPASKTHITFTGTVGQMRQAFHIDIHHLSVDGVAHQATMNEPQIPTALAEVVSGFRQLHDFGPKPASHFAGVFQKDAQTGKLKPVAGANHAPSADFTNQFAGETFYEVGPQDFYTIYNETPLLNNNINGAGVTIAVLELTQINPADPVSFRAQFGLPTYPNTPTSAAGGINYIYGGTTATLADPACTAPLSVSDGASSGDEGEADIDVEWAGTAAPNATIDFVACGTTAGAIGSFGTDLAAEHVANYLAGSVAAASLSYGVCEAETGNTNFYSGLWEQYAAQGQSIVVSTGDGGSLGCETLTNNPSVNLMSATAYNIAAGGTDLSDAYITNNYSNSPATTWWSNTNGTGLSSALSYIPEKAWSGYCSDPLFASYLNANGFTGFGANATPESICNNSAANADGLVVPVGGSGGPSAYTALPTWQSVYGIGLYSSSKTKRNQPDISLFAGNGFWGHALPYCESDQYTCDYSTNASDAYQLEAGGTSYVAPQIAGILALLNQSTGQLQGQANYTLYGLATQEYGTASTPNTANLSACSGSAQGASISTSCIFQDIAADTPSLQGGTIASNIVEPCTYASVTDCYRAVKTDATGLSAVTGATHSSTLAYSAGAGYDLATGLGSVNIANLVNGWNSLSTDFASTTALAVSATPIAYSTTPNLTLTATVTAKGRGSAVAPGGTVHFFSGGSISGTSLGSASIAANCTGTGSTTSCKGIAALSVATSNLVPGANSIVAYFGGDGANDAPSTSAAKAVTVNSWPQTVTITSANTGTYGSPLTLKATASSGLTTFTYSVVSGLATVNGSALTFTGVGTVVVQATQAGNATYAAASAQQTITVSAATPTLTVSSSLNPSTFGGSVTFTATISSGPTGTVTFYDGANAIGSTTLSGVKATYATTSMTAGSHSITASWAGNSNYNPVTSSAITQVVNQATPAITWATPAAITYGTALSATQLNATSTVAGTFTYSPVTGTVLTAGAQTLSVTFTPNDATDYATNTKTVTLTVKQAAPAITWATPTAITYGTALSATQLDATITWTVGGVSVSVPGAFTYNPAAGAVLTAGAHTLSATFAPSDTVDYATPAAKSVSLTVNKATPTLTWPIPASVPWNTALSATQLDASATWIVNGANGSVAGSYKYTPVAGTLMTKIGQNALSVTFTPTDTADYNTATTSVVLTVIQATPVITWTTPAPITYGTPLSATQLDATANVAGSFVYTPGLTTVLHAGLNTLSVTFTPTNGTDYSTATQTVQLQVNQVTPTVTWAAPAPINYGTALSATQLNATANVAGSFAYTPAAGSVLTAGAQTLSVTFTPTDSTDYATVTSTVPLTVFQVTPIITWPAPAAIYYGNALGAAQLDATALWTVAGTSGPVQGSYNYSAAAGSFPPVGTNEPLTVVFTPLDTIDYTSATYTVNLTVNPTINAVLSAPLPASGSILGPGPVTFSWTPGSGPSAYSLSVGTGEPGWIDLYSISNTTLTSATVNIPANGVTVWVRFFQNVAGVWSYTDYVYTESGTLIPAAINTPTPGTPLSGNVTFDWSGGAGPSYYQLLVGTEGVGTSNLLYVGNTQETSQAVNIPADGVNVYVRLNQLIDGAWQSIDYIYTETGTSIPSVLTSPSPGSTLSGNSATFQWSAGAGPSQYQLSVGTTGVGSHDLYYSGNTTAMQEIVNNIPADGVTIFVRLNQQIGKVWQSADYTFTESGTLVPAAIASPASGSTLPSGSVSFNWAGGVGPTEYRLLVGTTGVGSDDLYYSGVTTLTSETVAIPANGVTVFVRLYQMINGVWQSTDSTYTESGTIVPAQLISPTPGSVLTGSSAIFTWTAGTGPSQYELLVGTSGVGSLDLYFSGAVTATSSPSVTIPANGVTVYVRLYQRINGVWQFNDYTYTESGTIVPAAITSPAPGSTLTGSSVTFNWAGGVGPSKYQLLVGTSGIGSANLYYSSTTTATSATVTVPTKGAKVFARLYQMIDGVWQFADYTYIEQ